MYIHIHCFEQKNGDASVNVMYVHAGAELDLDNLEMLFEHGCLQKGYNGG